MEEINRTPFGKRLYDSREAANLTQEIAAKKVGMAQSTLAEAEISGKRSGYTSQLADLYDVSAKWLATGKRDNGTASQQALPLANTQSQSQSAEFGDSLPHPTEDEFALVQQLDLSASCGPGRFTEHVVVKGGLAFKRSSLRDLGVQEANARIIYASGDSMEPSISNGRVVLVDTADTKAEDNRVYLICDPDGCILLKRLIREYHPGSGHMRWIMRSDNPNKTHFPDKLLPDDDRTIIVGRAVWTDKML